MSNTAINDIQDLLNNAAEKAGQLTGYTLTYKFLSEDANSDETVIVVAGPDVARGKEWVSSYLRRNDKRYKDNAHNLTGYVTDLGVSRERWSIGR